MARALVKKAETSTTLLEAAKKVLRQNGHSGLSTRDVLPIGFLQSQLQLQLHRSRGFL